MLYRKLQRLATTPKWDDCCPRTLMHSHASMRLDIAEGLESLKSYQTARQAER